MVKERGATSTFTVGEGKLTDCVPGRNSDRVATVLRKRRVNFPDARVSIVSPAGK